MAEVYVSDPLDGWSRVSRGRLLSVDVSESEDGAYLIYKIVLSSDIEGEPVRVTIALPRSSSVSVSDVIRNLARYGVSFRSRIPTFEPRRKARGVGGSV